MAEEFVITQNTQADGQAFPTSRTVSAGQQYSNDVSVTAADAGTLTTRTDANTGVVTLTGGHSVVDGRVDVYWSGGSRIGMTATVTVNSVAIDLGTGDDLPAATTAVLLKNPQVLSPTVDGTAMVGLLVYSGLNSNQSNLPGTITFAEADATLIGSPYELTAAAPNQEWDGLAAASPLPETIGKVYFSHGNTSTIGMGVKLLYN